MDEDYPNPDFPPPPPPPPPAPAPRRFGGLGRSGAAAATAIGLAAGGVAGGFLISKAAATPSATASPTEHDSARPGLPGQGRLFEANGAQVAAKAIGITPAQLKTELGTDKTIADVARAHGVDPKAVVSALVAAASKGLDDAVAKGALTKAQADTAKSRLQQAVENQVNNVKGGFAGHGRPGFGPGGFGRGPLAPGEDLQVIATAIGIPMPQLLTELATDKTVAAVAQAHKVDPATVISALVISENKEIDDAVAKGQITASEATSQKATTKQKVTDLVNNALHTRHAGLPRPTGPTPAPTP